MRAAVLEAPNQPLRVEDLAMPEPRQGEVLVQVAGCGICHSDLHVMRGAIKHPTPCVLGHEISGTVAEIGTGVNGLTHGDRVVCAFIMPCGWCGPCQQGRDDRCETFFTVNRQQGALYDGDTRLRRPDGTELRMFSMSGHAEYAVVPATAVFVLPDDMDLVASAVVGCALFTAYGAIFRAARLQAGERVAVIGVGGIGSSIVQLASALGAEEIIAVDVRSDKIDLALHLGATQTVDASTVDPVVAVRDLTSGEGVEVAFEALGRPATLTQGLQLLSVGGRLVAVGLAAPGVAAEVEIGPLVRKQLCFIGSYGARTRTDMPKLLRLLSRSGARPDRVVTDRVGLDEINRAYEALEKGDVLGRAVIEF